MTKMGAVVKYQPPHPKIEALCLSIPHTHRDIQIFRITQTKTLASN